MFGLSSSPKINNGEAIALFTAPILNKKLYLNYNKKERLSK